MSDPSTDPTEPTEPVAEEAPTGSPDVAEAETPENPETPATAPAGTTQTVTRKAAALGLAGAFVVGGLVGWVGATAFDDDDTVPISAFQEGQFPGGPGGMPGGPGGMGGGGRHGGPHDQMGGGGFPGGPGGGFPGGELSDEQREELEQRLEDGELPPWVEEHLDDDGGDRGDGYDDEDQDQDQDDGA